MWRCPCLTPLFPQMWMNAVLEGVAVPSAVSTLWVVTGASVRRDTAHLRTGSSACPREGPPGWPQTPTEVNSPLALPLLLCLGELAGRAWDGGHQPAALRWAWQAAPSPGRSGLFPTGRTGGSFSRAHVEAAEGLVSAQRGGRSRPGVRVCVPAPATWRCRTSAGDGTLLLLVRAVTLQTRTVSNNALSAAWHRARHGPRRGRPQHGGDPAPKGRQEWGCVCPAIPQGAGRWQGHLPGLQGPRIGGGACHNSRDLNPSPGLGGQPGVGRAGWASRTQHLALPRSGQ